MVTLAGPTPALADAAARERLLADLQRTFFVEAGAGTGKTTLLVGRIVALVAAGQVEMEHLAAMTFTEAAAAELRDRVREGLERAAVEGQRSEQERARCRKAAGEIDRAAISTIHSFCGVLLRTFPLEAGLPPGFATLDDVEQGVLFEERWKEWFWNEALEDLARPIVRRALLLGLSQEEMRALAGALESQHDLLTPETFWSAPESPNALATAHQVGRTLLDLEPWKVHAQDGPEDPLVQTIAKAQMPAQRLVRAVTEDEALAALQALGTLNKRDGLQKRWGRLPDGRNACKAIKDAIEEANTAVTATLEGHRAATFASVLGLLRGFVLDGVQRRKRDGVATFQDLLAWTRDLLRDQPSVRRRAQARYQRIFVDELQDTDPLQAEIALYLAADERAGEPRPTDWRTTPLVPGKLFLVGDPKQSIYRFRRADLALYDALLTHLQEGQERLVQNFRSVRPVLAWVNHHFAEHMRAEPGVQPPYVDLAASHETHAGGTPCGVYRVGAAMDGDAGTVAQAEAESLAALAHEAVEDGWLVSDRGPGGERLLRPARYRDVCLLLPSRTHLRRFERALEAAGVPYRIEAGKLVLATQDVRDLLACLRAIEDPSDQVALVAALRSPAYACSDVDLLAWVEKGGQLNYEHPGAGPDGPVAQALASLASFHARRQRLSPPALVEVFLRDRLLVAACFGEARPREAWRRLRYVVARARAFTATGRHTLRAFLDWISGLERAEARDTESADAETDEDAVRILTIHGSKGLEFPIVLLAGLGAPRGGGPTTVNVIADRATGALACSAGKLWRTIEYEDAQAREKVMADNESVRLLYVATTRARDHLVLSLHRGQKASNSHAALIEQQLEAFAGTCPPLAPARSQPREDAPHQEHAEPVANVDGEGEKEEARWLEERQDLVRRLAAQSVSGASLSAEIVDGDAGAASGDRVRSLVRRAWRTGIVPDADNDVDEEAVLLARAILASPPVRRAREARLIWHALPVWAIADGAVLDRVIDLVYETADGSHVLVLYDTRKDGRATDCTTTAVGLSQAYAVLSGRSVRAVDVVHAESGRVTRVVGAA